MPKLKKQRSLYKFSRIRKIIHTIKLIVIFLAFTILILKFTKKVEGSGSIELVFKALYDFIIMCIGTRRLEQVGLIASSVNAHVLERMVEYPMPEKPTIVFYCDQASENFQRNFVQKFFPGALGSKDFSEKFLAKLV